MDNSTPNYRRLAAVLAAATIAAGAHAAEPLPISLDAESSSFDRQSNTVVFRRLTITQGEMQIRADEAVAAGLDFEEASWRFTGNVVLTIESARVEADRAEIVFVANGLQSAELVGTPATFEHVGEAGAEPIRGGATRLAYDNSARIMHMFEGAWFNQGPNEFRGCDLIYDLDREQITSGSSDCGEPVVITIVPRNGEDESERSPAP